MHATKLYFRMMRGVLTGNSKAAVGNMQGLWAYADTSRVHWVEVGVVNLVGVLVLIVAPILAMTITF